MVNKEKTMRSKFKIINVKSVFSFTIMIALLAASCNLDTGGNGGGYEEDPYDDSSIFTHFFTSAVFTIVVDTNGGKWFASKTGIRYLDDNNTPTNQADDTWTTIIDNAGLLDNYVFEIAIDTTGGKWFCSSGGVSYLDDNGTPTNKEDDTWTTFNTPNLRNITIDASGGKWFTTYINPFGGGVRYLDDNGTPRYTTDDIWTTFSTTDGLADNSVFAIAIDGSGNKWFATYFNGGISCLDDNGTPSNKADDTWTTFTTADGLVDNDSLSIFIDASGGKWFGSEGGLSYLDDNETPSNKADDTWSTFTTFDGLANNIVKEIFIDASGGKWLGTYGGGISHLDDNGTPANKSDDTWITFSPSDGLPYDFVGKITVDPAGGMWLLISHEGRLDQSGCTIIFFDDNGTLTNKTDDTWMPFYIEDGLAGNNVSAIGIDGFGEKWIGSTDRGLSYLDDNGTPENKTDDTWATFTTAHGLVDNNVMAVTLDGSGGKWLGTYNGINYFDDNGTPTNKADDTWTTFTTIDGLASNDVRAIEIDNSGGKWFGTWVGVSYLNDGGTPSNKIDDTWQIFTTSMGLSNNRVLTICINSTGGKWFGTYGGGVSYLNDNGTPTNTADDTWTTFTTIDGLISNDIKAIGIDAFGGKWFCTAGGGVCYLDDGGTPSEKGDDSWIVFSESDGLQSDWIDAIAIDGLGNKWLGASYISLLDDNGTPLNKGDDTVSIFDSNSPPMYVQTIEIDASDAKWFGSREDAGLNYCP